MVVRDTGTETRMAPADLTAKKRCPKCQCDLHLFRARTTIPAKGTEPRTIETKFRCRSCGHVWTLTVAA
jgi:C4-type Zn-finger protein